MCTKQKNYERKCGQDNALKMERTADITDTNNYNDPK
jgi:hypothetical protein